MAAEVARMWSSTDNEDVRARKGVSGARAALGDAAKGTKMKRPIPKETTVCCDKTSKLGGAKTMRKVKSRKQPVCNKPNSTISPNPRKLCLEAQTPKGASNPRVP